MLNGQKFYGQTLKLTMNNSKDTNLLLPKGLADVGPGLGKYGKGLPDLVEQYKRFVKGRKTLIDVNLFQPELLRKIGIDPERDCPTPIVRSVISNSSSNHNDNASEQGSDVSQTDSNSTRNNENHFGVIGQRIANCLIHTANAPNTLSTTQFHNNRVPNFTPLNQSVTVRSNGPVLSIRGQNSAMPISSSVQTPRHLPPPPNAMPSYCPPIPGVDTTNTIRGSYNISVMGATPRPAIPGSIMTRGPLPSPLSSPMNPVRRLGPIPMAHMSNQTNRFPGPGPSNVGPNFGPRAPVPVQNPIQVSNPGIQPRQYMSSNVHMYKGADPVTIQISNVSLSFYFILFMYLCSFKIIFCACDCYKIFVIKIFILTRKEKSINNHFSILVLIFRFNRQLNIMFCQLPPSTNFVNLGQKLSEFGHVVFLEFTTPGCAVVRFGNPTEADRCIRILL